MSKRELMPIEVFQPGKADPTDMYVSRPEIEKQLVETPYSDKASLMIGGAGSGKSWLYRRFFAEIRAEHAVLPMARDYVMSLRQLIDNELARLGVSRPSRERKFIGTNEGVMLGHEGLREFDGFDALMALADKLRKKAGRRPAYIVVENVEQGLTDSSGRFVTDMINLVMSSDQLAKSEVRLLLVGADDRLRAALANTAISEPHMRRLHRPMEVTSFTESEARIYLDRGFRQKLGIRIKDIDELVRACHDATDLRPDLLSEYCLLLAKAARNRLRVVEDFDIATANQAWGETKLSPYLERIATAMNTRDTRKRIRNKMLYALSRRAMRGYTRQNIQDFLREDFPTESFQSNEITSALQALCMQDTGSEPLLRRFGSDSSPLFAFAGATERVATVFALGRVGNEIRLNS